jgi:hypothetical protein
MASVSSLIAQLGSGSTHSTHTVMGTWFESASRALPITSAMATFLSTASARPTVAQATSAVGLKWQAVTVTLYPNGNPSPEDVNQHAIGDCDGDAVLASLAYVNPTFLKSLITDNHDGTFDVAMFDPAGKAISVAVDSAVLVEKTNIAQLAAVSARDGSADWATVLEKAIMKYDVAYNTVGQMDGIGSEYLLPMLTGNGDSIAFAPGTLTNAQLQEVVTTSLAAGRFITGGFNRVLTIGSDKTVTGHGFTVMVPTNPSSDMLDMRNPWGINPWASSSTSGYDTSSDGLLHIPLAITPADWTRIVDLRIIDPGASCTGITTPFVPRLDGPTAPVRIREPHVQDGSLTP